VRAPRRGLPAAVLSGPSTRALKVSASAAAEAVSSGSYVEVHYTGTLDDGTEFDSSKGRDPLSFVVGEGRVVPGFEDIVSGMTQGESRKQRIEPARAYGEWREEMTAQVPLAQAPAQLKPGMKVQLQSGAQATVTAVDDTVITIDANPELAGKALTFDVQLVKHVPESRIQKVAFGAGCFWSVELEFQRLPGVLTTQVS
jgi:FKBP-type peptidyl-prolyl cis-trans isomerase 2